MRVIGQHFGGYQVIREIGQGAVSRVFLASDGRRVKAVKLFRPEHVARARRELTYGRDLDHPNLNPVEDWLELAGRPGVVMPYVPGVLLSRWRDAGDRRSFLGAMKGVLQALAHLHDLGIVHRDVKPENILVDRSGQSVLVDYDLATGVDAVGESITAAGTVAFISPEQARGEPALPGSDLYSVGVILYWGLTGEVPFTGSVEQVMRAHARKSPPAARGIDPDLEAFEPLLEKLLAKEPDKRYRYALEVLGELELIESRTFGEKQV
ncbi:MAG TPA: serine/threonine-protein kinase [Trueperaceae bacterium]